MSKSQRNFREALYCRNTKRGNTITNEDFNLFLGNDNNKNKNKKQLSSMVLDIWGSKYAVSQIKKT